MVLRLSFLLLLSSVSLAQERSLPIPKFGWDSLQSALQFPPMGVNVGHRTAYMVSVGVDSAGVLKSVSVSPYIDKISIDNVEYSCPLNPFDSLFIESINEACHRVLWVAGKVKGQAVSMDAEFPVIFNIYSYQTPADSRRMIIKEVVRRLDVDYNVH